MSYRRHTLPIIQAARNAACLVHALHLASVDPHSLSSFGFYVIAPETQIEAGIFSGLVTKESILDQVSARVAQFSGKHDRWFNETFRPALALMDIGLFSWESTIRHLEDRHEESELWMFYRECLRFNPMRRRGPS